MEASKDILKKLCKTPRKLSGGTALPRSTFNSMPGGRAFSAARGQNPEGDSEKRPAQISFAPSEVVLGSSRVHVNSSVTLPLR